MGTVKSTEWITALSKELKGYPALAVKMTAMRLAPSLGLTYASEMSEEEADRLAAATRAAILKTLDK